MKTRSRRPHSDISPYTGLRSQKIASSLAQVSHVLASLALLVPIALFFDRAAPNTRSLFYFESLRTLWLQDFATFSIFIACSFLFLGWLYLLTQYFAEKTSHELQQHQSKNLQNRLLENLFQAEVHFVQQSAMPARIEQMLNASVTVSSGIAEKIRVLSNAFPTLILSLALVALVDTSFFFLFILCFSVDFFSRLYFRTKKNSISSHYNDQLIVVKQELINDVLVLEQIKSLSADALVQKRNRDLLSSLRQLRESSLFGSVLSKISMTGTIHILRGLILLLSGAAYARQEISLGSVALLLLTSEILRKTIDQLIQLPTSQHVAKRAAEKIRLFIDEAKRNEEEDGSQAITSLPFPDATGLHFEDVSLVGNKDLTLRSFTQHFSSGEMIALLGSPRPVSQFIRLFNRISDPSRGRITYGRTDIRKYKFEVLRNLVTVSYNASIFLPMSIRENLLLGALENETDELKIYEALRAADASDFVQALPEKLETVLTKDLALTDDELQRLNLARAFLKTNSQIFVFEDPLSSLMPESQQVVTDSIRSLTERGAIVFWTTTNLEEIPQPDRVLVIKSNQNPLERAHLADAAEKPRASQRLASKSNSLTLT